MESRSNAYPFDLLKCICNNNIPSFLNSNFPHIAGSVHSVAEALLLLLESTAEPLIPYNLHNVCLSAATNYLQCKQVN